MVQKNTIFKNTILKKIPILIFICLFLLTSCNKDAEIFIGTVHTIDAENKRILVVSGLKEADFNKSSKELLNSNEYAKVIWVSKVSPSRFKQGDKIEITYTASDDSYPAQVTAKKISKIRK
ncbi:hypothetical protein QW71_02740 [Paenibacillus sp. IHB B 3415]|uniref:DUF3221 domain-containing protein n=1 Tax=Paenibacillus sp. IHB B 3415 TaxID=867080 RepID=UPI000573E1EA|nr:DUF3221 domain-containing protein [Paenibacillus sp. IHB B 3415]KHL97104.1 hypothetical protein QW71_02740 [Paenibacillus sp. IHB B 3415]